MVDLIKGALNWAILVATEYMYNLFLNNSFILVS